MSNRRTRDLLAARVAPAVAVLGLAGLLAGCGASTGAPDPTSAGPSAGPVTEFEGPYAEEFAQDYAETDSAFVRQVLEDGQISDAEYAEMAQQFSDCLADEGIAFGGFGADGSYSTSLAPNGGDTHALINACSTSVGEDRIGSLYTFVRLNPDNLDYLVAVPRCLVDAGVVPAGYGPAEYEADVQGRFADLAALEPGLRDALIACNDDPTGLRGEDGVAR